MKEHPYLVHPWKIIEKGFDPSRSEISESIFSQGNGYMGHRANFEEDFSGDTLQGTYIAGIYYPDKTKVGWWKNGYPEYFAKVPNAPYWGGIRLKINGRYLDLNRMKLLDFERTLDMKHALLERRFTVELPGKKQLSVHVSRFLSMAQKEMAVIRYAVTPLNFDASIQLETYIDGGIKNRDANYGEYFWQVLNTGSLDEHSIGLEAETKKTHFRVYTAARHRLELNGRPFNTQGAWKKTPKRSALVYSPRLKQGNTLTLYKYVVVTHSNHFPAHELEQRGLEILDRAVKKGYKKLLAEHRERWDEIWRISDVKIEGDESAQQAIRYNILQLNQTYTGEDPRLNIGPKGFTGEKYGGTTYWDTEAFCVPFYLATKPRQVGENLLMYRYRHLPKAIENARKLGFTGGAALYPMVTVNGEECHNEWEITFEEIHRNGSMVYAIDYYTRYTGDHNYLHTRGMEVVIAIARFWAQRVNFSEEKQKYVILGVTGPNEYENNVNNNWFTNYIARWNLQYAVENLEKMQQEMPDLYNQIKEKTNLKPGEIAQWKEIIRLMYLPYDEKRGIFLQQDGFTDKELKPVSAIPAGEHPLNQHWSWDRILRSCYIKQADVLQGMYYFENDFDRDFIRRHFDFYEPMTVHESSLSPGVHGVIAALTGKTDKSYEMFMRSARLDLDDYNREAGEGLHITSMAGTWLVLAHGLAGLKVKDGKMELAPVIPAVWKEYEFKIMRNGGLLKIRVNPDHVELENQGENPLELSLYGHPVRLDAREKYIHKILVV